MKNRNASKFLSLVLRHKPESIDIQLDKAGWANVSELIEKMNKVGYHLTMDKLQEVVKNNDKQRFSFSEDLTMIRANQGHSIDVQLGYVPVKPPETLYHGTALRNKELILQGGIDKRQRHHVHLSSNKDTALNVGQRHGKPFIFVVLSRKMYEDGIQFFQSENNVWLTDYIDPKYLSEMV